MLGEREILPHSKRFHDDPFEKKMKKIGIQKNRSFVKKLKI